MTSQWRGGHDDSPHGLGQQYQEQRKSELDFDRQGANAPRSQMEYDALAEQDAEDGAELSQAEQFDSSPTSAVYEKLSSVVAEDPDANNANQEEMYEAGLSALASFGFSATRSPTGTHCGHEVRVLSNPEPIQGIRYPAGFNVWRLLSTQAEERALYAAIMYHEGLDDATKEFWQPFVVNNERKYSDFQGWVDRMTAVDGNAVIEGSHKPFNLGISFSPAKLSSRDRPRAWVPERSWFSPAMQNVRFEDVFTLWPPAEQRMLKLLIGRTVVGRSYHIPVGCEKPIEHTMRSIGIIVGEDPGMGKSTTFRALLRAMTQIGYRYANFRSMDDNFNLAGVVSRDLIYKDDLTPKSLEELLKSENAKIIASEGQIRTAEKFQNASDVWSNCVIFANSNSIDPHSSYNIDPGMADRVKLLSTYRKIELAKIRLDGVSEDSPDLRPFLHLDWLSKKLGVSIDALMIWCVRLSADFFLELIESEDRVALENEVRRTSARLRMSFDKDATKQVLTTAIFSDIMRRHLTVTTSHNKPYRCPEIGVGILKEALHHLWFVATDPSTACLRTMMKEDWEAKDRPEEHCWCGLRKLQLLSVRHANRAIIDCASADMGSSDLIKNVFGKLILRNGFHLSSSAVWVTKAWDGVRPMAEELEVFARECTAKLIDRAENHDDLAAAECLAGLADQRRLPNDAYLTNSAYSPDDVEVTMKSLLR